MSDAIKDAAIRRDCRINPTDAPKQGNGRLMCIIPSHNYEAYIERAIKSVLAQTRPADEVIIIDDCSTDNTLKIIEAYKDTPTVKIVKNPRNLGLSATRNRAIMMTDAEFIVAIDSDDWCEPEYFESMLRTLESDPTLGVAYSSIHPYNEQIKAFYSVNNWPPQFDWAWTAKRILPPRTMIPASAMYRREMWRLAGGFLETYTRAEDAEFWLRGLSIGFGVKKADERGLYHWVYHGENLSLQDPPNDIHAWLPFMWRNDAPMNAPAPNKLMRDYTTPTISVIITIGPGHGKYAGSAIESVIGQTFWNWELVIIDDSGETIDFSRFPFATIINIGKGNGASAARNEGLRHIKAPFVVFLDGDDFLHPFTLQRMAETYTANGQRGFIYTDVFEYVDVNGAKSSRPRQLADFNPDTLAMFGAVTTLMRTDDARQLGFDETMLDGGEDKDFYLRARLSGLCGVRVPEPLLYYRVTSGMLRRRSAEKSTELDALFNTRYGEYLRGVKEMGSCCGGDAGAQIIALKQALGGLPNVQNTSVTPEGKTKLQYIGEAYGGIWFLGRYFAGNNDTDRYIDADPNDVARLTGTGQFVVVNAGAVAEPMPYPIVQTEMPEEAFLPAPPTPEAQIANETVDAEVAAMLSERNAEIESAKEIESIVPTEPTETPKAARTKRK